MSDRDRDREKLEGGHPLGDGDIHGAPDATIGGYLKEHSRPPAFEGRDGQPYTVSVEVQKTGNLLAPFEGYLVFPRWASSGLGVVDHLESGTLLTGTNQDRVREQLGNMSLVQVKLLLDRTIVRATEGGAEGEDPAVEEGSAGDEDPEAP